MATLQANDPVYKIKHKQLDYPFEKNWGMKF